MKPSMLRYPEEFSTAFGSFTELPCDPERFEQLLTRSRLGDAFAILAPFVRTIHRPFTASGVEFWPFELGCRIFAPQPMVPSLCFLGRVAMQGQAPERREFRARRRFHPARALGFFAALIFPAFGISALATWTGMLGFKKWVTFEDTFSALSTIVVVAIVIEWLRRGMPLKQTSNTTTETSSRDQITASKATGSSPSHEQAILDRLIAACPEIKQVNLALEESEAFLLLQFETRTGIPGQSMWVDEYAAPVDEFASKIQALQLAVNILVNLATSAQVDHSTR